MLPSPTPIASPRRTAPPLKVTAMRLFNKLFASRQEFYGICIALTFMTLAVLHTGGYDFGSVINFALGMYTGMLP